jgi:hypothetical protein
VLTKDVHYRMCLTQASPDVAFDEFGDPVAGGTAEAYLSSPPVPDKPSRTWGQWVQYKITAPFESTLTAVGISYWVANMLSAGINSRVRRSCCPLLRTWPLFRSPWCSGNRPASFLTCYLAVLLRS